MVIYFLAAWAAVSIIAAFVIGPWLARQAAAQLVRSDRGDPR